jgi:hypothetical protein
MHYTGDPGIAVRVGMVGRPGDSHSNDNPGNLGEPAAPTTIYHGGNHTPHLL